MSAAVGTAGSLGANKNIVIDTTAPAAPSAPDMAAASDSGSSNTDNYTNVTTPTFSGTAEANSTVTLYRSGLTLIGSASANASGAWTIISSALPVGVYSITAKATDLAGNVSVASAALSITIDTSAPAAPPPPDLNSASDSGFSNSDNITNVTTPTFNGTAEAASTVKLFRAGSTLIGSVAADGSGNWTIVSSTLPAGVNSITATATDLAGNVSAASSALSVTIDTTAPTISNVTSTAANGNYIAGATIAITVVFSDIVYVTGTPQLALNSGASANYTSGSGSNTLTFNYTVAAGQNSAALDYMSTSALTLNGGTIRDVAANNASLTLASPAAAGSLSASNSIVIDTTPPAASAGGETPSLGDTALTFTIVYSDALTGVDDTTLDSSDVTVTGPNGFSAAATFVSVDDPSDGSPRTATYSIPAPGGLWDAGDNGTYTISQNANQVADVAGNFSAAGTIGTFDANVPFAYLSGTTLNIDYDPGQSSVTISDDGSGHIVATEDSSLSFASTDFNSIQIHDVAGGSDAVVIATALVKPLALDGQATTDAITIASGGSYTFAADIGATGASVGVAVSAGGSATFAAPQHLSSLSIDGTAAVTPGQSVAIVTNALSITGKLDLADGAIAVHYTGSSPLCSWSGSAYDGITGLIAAGRNGGGWDGNGIVTSMAAAQGSGARATIGVAEASEALGLGQGQTALWSGQTVDATSVLVRYVLSGDANLDGTIDGDDYFSIDSGYSAQSPEYAAGDFNYDGRIDADDYFLIDSNYGQAATVASAMSVPASQPPASINPVAIFGAVAISSSKPAPRSLITELFDNDADLL